MTFEVTDEDRKNAFEDIVSGMRWWHAKPVLGGHMDDHHLVQKYARLRHEAYTSGYSACESLNKLCDEGMVTVTRATLDMTKTMLYTAIGWLNDYASNHKAKGTVDSDIKAQINITRAEMLQEVVSHLEKV